MNNTKKYNKGITITSEELELIGRNLEIFLNKEINNGCSPERFKAYKQVLKRLEESKNK